MRRFFVLVILLLFGSVMLLAQADTSSVLKPITLPTGFNWLYIVFFAVGMMIHYGVKVFHVLGSSKFFVSLYKNFPGWFINKFHYTALSGAAVAIISIASAYELNVSFSVINLLGVVVSLMAGYIGDSMFNAGEIK